MFTALIQFFHEIRQSRIINVISRYHHETIAWVIQRLALVITLTLFLAQIIQWSSLAGNDFREQNGTSSSTGSRYKNNKHLRNQTSDRIRLSKTCIVFNEFRQNSGSIAHVF